MNFTPGPWVFEYRSGDHPLSDRSGWGCEGLWAVDGGLILGDDIGWDGGYEGPNEANARLIAAAPELLEALQWFVENDDTYQGDTPMPEHGGLTWNEINAEFIDGLNKARAAIAKATGERHETPSER